MNRTLRYVECPRDAWQSLPHVLGTADKIAHAERLIAAGFTELDLVSFVSKKAVPQMADSEDVLAGLAIPATVDVIGIIGNEAGYDRALATGKVTTVGYPHSLNETFQQRNLRTTVAESWDRVTRIAERAKTDGLNVQVYVSMGFGNPYGEPWTAEETIAEVKRILALTPRPVVIADTAGTATPERVEAVLQAAERAGVHPEQLGLHLHAAPDAWQALLAPAIAYGVTWFEGALAGQGGCPFAASELVGNIPTELVVPYLLRHGYESPIRASELPQLAQAAHALSY